MIRIFNGKWRGLGKSEKKVYIQLDVKFRKILNQFRGPKLHVFMCIALHTNENGIAFPSYDLMQKETGYKRPTIAKAIRELSEMEIDGFRVLDFWRERDDDGKFTGGNHYLIFPEDVQSKDNPELDPAQRWIRPNVGSTELKEEPLVKEESKKQKEEEKDNDNVFESNGIKGKSDFQDYHNRFGYNNIFEMYAREISELTPSIRDRLIMAEKDYGAGWVADAILIAVKNNVRKWQYIQAILKDWDKRGEQTDRGYNKYLDGKFADFVEGG